MNQKILMKMIAALSLTGMVGCNDSGGGGAATPAGSASKLDLAKVSELQGTWRTECFDFSEPRNPSSVLTVIKVSGQNIEFRNSRWINSSCSGAASVMEKRNYEITRAGDSVDFGQSIDLKFLQGSIFLNTADAVENYKRAGECGTSKWKLGENDITRLKCEGRDEGNVFYTAFLIENNTLSLADSSEEADGSSNELRAKSYSGISFMKAN